MLTCEQKLFFNPVWQETFSQKTAQPDNQTKITKKFDIKLHDTEEKQYICNQSAVRNSNILQVAVPKLEN